MMTRIAEASTVFVQPSFTHTDQTSIERSNPATKHDQHENLPKKTLHYQKQNSPHYTSWPLV